MVRELTEAGAKARRPRVVENENEIAAVDPRTVVIVFASGDDESLALEERSDARDRIEARVASPEPRAKNESGNQQDPTKPFSVAPAVHDPPTHPRLVLTPTNAAACEDPVTVDENEVAHAELLEIIEKGREPFPFQRSEERRDVGIEQRKARITVGE